MCSDVTCNYTCIRQIKVKVESVCLNVSYLTPKPNVHTEICMLGSGGIMGDIRLFGSKKYILGNIPYFYTIKDLEFVVGGQSLCLIGY